MAARKGTSSRASRASISPSIAADRRQRVVRIDVHGTETREVLGRGHDTAALQAAGERCRVATHRNRIGPERPRSEAGIARFDGHIADRGVVDRDAQGAQLPRHGSSGRLRERHIIGRTQGHGAGEARAVVAQTDQLAALLIGTDQERQVTGGRRVQGFGQRRHAIGIGRVGPQEHGDAVRVTSRDATQQPARRLGPVKRRQKLSQHRLLGQQRAGSGRAPAGRRRTLKIGRPSHPLCTSSISGRASP